MRMLRMGNNFRPTFRQMTEEMTDIIDPVGTHQILRSRAELSSP